MSTFQLSVVSSERLLLEGEVDQVDLPGAEGDFASWPYADHCDASSGDCDCNSRKRPREVRGVWRYHRVFERNSRDVISLTRAPV